MNRFAGQRVIVVGLAATGFATARVLLDEGAEVVVTETASTPAIEERAERLRTGGAAVETGGHDLEKLHADLAVVSPGIPPTAPVIRALDDAAVPLISEVELAYRLADCEFLAVTGTNGKTTTTSLLASMLERAGLDSLAAGNIGLPLVEAVGRVPHGGAIAAEVSSFQLTYIDRFRARVAVILNIAEDHMDWHGGMEPYAAAKARIFENQTPDDTTIVNRDDETVMELAMSTDARLITFSTSQRTADATFRDGSLFWQDEHIADVSDIRLRGRAGWEDALAAVAAALSYGVDLAAARGALLAFEPLSHRIEEVAVVAGVTFIDDSKSTNPHATLTAVAGLNDVVLIAGGRSKGMDLGPLAATVPPVIAVVTLGEAAGEVMEVFGDLVPTRAAATMDEAVKLASDMSVPGGSVLLSPACASLDMYGSYAERGDAFARAVRDLGSQGEE